MQSTANQFRNARAEGARARRAPGLRVEPDHAEVHVFDAATGDRLRA